MGTTTIQYYRVGSGQGGGLAGLPQQPKPIDGRSTAIRGWTRHHGWAGLRTCNSLWPAFADATLDVNVVHAII